MLLGSNIYSVLASNMDWLSTSIRYHNRWQYCNAESASSKDLAARYYVTVITWMSWQHFWNS